MKVEPKILIVEDEGRMRDLLVRAVSSWGLQTASARSGEEALRLMEAEPSNIVVADLNLPTMGGIELLEKVREKWPLTQAIILTGFGDLASARQAIHLDVVEFLTKPCHLGELEQAVDRATRRLMEQSEQQPPELPHFQPQLPENATPATLDELERQHILAALARNKGNRAATAAELGISLRTLYYRLNEYQKLGYQID